MKKVKNPFDTLLEHSCSNFVDYKDHEKWEKEHPFVAGEPTPYYPGWRIFRIDLCCTAFEVTARRISDDGEYEVSKMEQVE